MKKLNYLFITILSIIFTSYTLATAFRKGFRKFNYLTFRKLNEAFFDTTNFNILFLGNSFTYTGIQPNIIDSITGLNSFNLGMSGAEIREMEYLFENYLTNHPSPQILILQFHSTSFYIESRNNLIFYPFLSKPQKIDNFIDPGSEIAILIKNLIPFYRYTFFDDYHRVHALKGLIGRNQGEKGILYSKGFLKLLADSTPIHQIILDKFIYPDFTNQEFAKFQQINFFALNKINQICNKRNIKLVLLFPPMPFTSEYCNKETKLLKEFISHSVRRPSYTILDFSNIKDSQKPIYFVDEIHLNWEGSRIISQQLGNRITEILKEN